MIPEFLGPLALGILIGVLVVLVVAYFFIEIVIVPKEECPHAAHFNREP